MASTLKGQMTYGSGYGFNSMSRHSLITRKQTRHPLNQPNIWADWFFGGVPSYTVYELNLADTIGGVTDFAY